MKEIKLNNEEYALFKVNKEDYNFHIKDGEFQHLCWTDLNSKTCQTYDESYFYNKYKIIGVLSDILKDEDICKELVEEIVEDEYQGYKHYHNKGIMNENDWCSHYIEATDSFLSYLQSIDLDLTKQFLLIQKL